MEIGPEVVVNRDDDLSVEGLAHPQDVDRGHALDLALGQRVAEVAEMLNVSVAAVKSRLHRARIALRDRLDRYFQDRVSRKDRPRPAR